MELVKGYYDKETDRQTDRQTDRERFITSVLNQDPNTQKVKYFKGTIKNIILNASFRGIN